MTGFWAFEYDGVYKLRGEELIYFFVAVACAFIAAKIAENRGRGYPSWWFIGLLFGPLGVIFALIASKNEAQIAADNGLRKCPQCAEYIKRDAKVCRFCRFNFTKKEDGEHSEEAAVEPLPVAPIDETKTLSYRAGAAYSSLKIKRPFAWLGLAITAVVVFFWAVPSLLAIKEKNIDSSAAKVSSPQPAIKKKEQLQFVVVRGETIRVGISFDQASRALKKNEMVREEAARDKDDNLRLVKHYLVEGRKISFALTKTKGKGAYRIAGIEEEF